MAAWTGGAGERRVAAQGFPGAEGLGTTGGESLGQTMACMGLTETEVNLLGLPLFHVAALNSALAIMHAGGTNVLTPRFDAEQAVRLIDTHRVTCVTSFPPILTNLLDAAARLGSQLPSLKHVSGLEGPDAIQRLHHTTSAQFWTGLGQTETSGFVTLQRAAEATYSWIINTIYPDSHFNMKLQLCCL